MSGDRHAGVAPRQPWLHDLQTCVDGNTTALSGADGQLDGTGAQGVYVDDRRVLCRLEVQLGDEPTAPVSASSAGARSGFWGAARHLGAPGPDPTVEVHRDRQLHGGGLRETVRVVSRSDAPVRTDLVVMIGGDGADIGAVKSGLVDARPLAAAWDGTVLTWRDARHVTTVAPSPAPSRVMPGASGEASALTFALTVPARGEAGVVLEVRTRRKAPTSLDADAASPRVAWSEVRVAADDPRLGPAVETSLTDLQHLLLSDPQAPQDFFAGAGTPWYLTLFGRDSIWAARMMLPFGTELAGGTLRALARRQGTRRDRGSAEAPGKIPHELRRTAYRDRAHGLHLPPTYYGTIDATPLWICLLHDAWRWGLPADQVEALLPALRAAATWLTELAAPDGDGLLKYLDESGTGLANQGWKDSGDAIRWRDGRIATAPIALVEAQAYAVEAADAAAAVFDAFGQAGGPALREWAGRMRERVRQRFWVGPAQDRYLALAVDADGQAVDGLASNMGHALGTGTLERAEAEQVAATLTSAPLLGRYGVGTLASDNGGFNPIGYHTGSIWTHDTAICAWGLAREGRPEAARVAQSLLASAEAFGYRWPELYAGAGVLGRPAPYPAACRPQAWSAASAAVLLHVALGFEPDAPARRLVLRPARPAPYGALTVHGLRFAGHELAVRCAADGTVEVLESPGGVRVDVV